MNDDFINGLAADLRPVKPLSAGQLWLIAALIFVVTAMVVVGVYQMRPELAHDTMANILLAPMLVIKPVYFLGLGLLGMLAVKGLSRPDGHISPLTLGTIALLLMGLIFSFTQAVTGADSGEFARQLAMSVESNRLCVGTIMGGGLAAWFALWAFWLRKTATQWPRTLGALSALSSAGLSAGAYALHCQMDSPIYIVVFYIVPVAIMTIIGAALGSRLLRW
jgi:hypothetical protein